MSPYIVKTNGDQEEFSKQKLCSSLVRSGADMDLAKDICIQVQQVLTPAMTTSQIWREAMRLLVKEDLLASARYSLRRGMAELGPDGFLFEKFVATLFEQHGYTTQVNLMQKGASGLTHEVDVRLEKDGVVSFVEAKYKNQHGLKTHVDVVMYGDARFQDMVNYERSKEKGKVHTKYELWLVTNTEFTTSSKTYAQYKNINLLGWDYPEGRSLEDMIVEKKVYPVTILPSLTRKDRQKLIRHGIILAQDLLPYKEQDLIQMFQIPKKRAKVLADEINEIMH